MYGVLFRQVGCFPTDDLPPSFINTTHHTNQILPTPILPIYQVIMLYQTHIDHNINRPVTFICSDPSLCSYEIIKKETISLEMVRHLHVYTQCTTH